MKIKEATMTNNIDLKDKSQKPSVNTFLLEDVIHGLILRGTQRSLRVVVCVLGDRDVTHPRFVVSHLPMPWISQQVLKHTATLVRKLQNVIKQFST